MDLTTVVMPGAQSLVTAILTETWGQARTAISKLWARRGIVSGTSAYAEPDVAAIEQAGHELEAARQQALELAGSGSESDRAARMQLFWAGYLAGQLAARPELADALAQLPTLLGAGAATSQTTTVHNTISGTVRGSALQAGDIHGNITFGR
jgi:hypothetical protein